MHWQEYIWEETDSKFTRILAKQVNQFYILNTDEAFLIYQFFSTKWNILRDFYQTLLQSGYSVQAFIHGKFLSYFFFTATSELKMLNLI